jgi:putative GTP pyrophosphokinase
LADYKERKLIHKQNKYNMGVRADYQDIKNSFRSINSTLKLIAKELENHIYEILDGIPHIDRVTCRVKSEESFLNKSLKVDNGRLKYKTPLKEIQDQIGARIVIYYKNDIQVVEEVIKKFFHFVETKNIVPEDVYKFGYEGVHYVCFIPNTIYSNHNDDHNIPDFFELQIKTLYQHAWSQAEHGLGYKPGVKLSYDDERKLALIAAQSWGADKILEEMVDKKFLN